MSDLNNDIPMTEEPNDPTEPASPRPMLTTMVLLIAAFSLTSLMMLHHIADQQGADSDDTALAKEEEGFNLDAIAGLFKRSKPAANTNAVQAVEVAVVAELPKEKKESSGFKLFGDRGDKVRWPKMKLTGFGTSADGSGGFAIINDKQIHPGQLVDGKAKLLEVRDHDVVVEYQGETKTLTVDVRN